MEAVKADDQNLLPPGQGLRAFGTLFVLSRTEITQEPTEYDTLGVVCSCCRYSAYLGSPGGVPISLFHGGKVVQNHITDRFLPLDTICLFP